MRIFRDTESGLCYELAELKESHAALVENSETELVNFNNWLADCVGKNGTLEEITALVEVIKEKTDATYELAKMLDNDGELGLADVLAEALCDIAINYGFFEFC